MCQEINILMVEDRQEDAYLIKHALKKESLPFQSVIVDTEESFIKEIHDFCPDIILSDHSLPQFDSEQALKVSQEICPEVPFILVTGTVSEEFAVKILKQGASDYILKTNLSRLASAILQALKQKELKLEKERVEETLRQQNAELKKINAELDKFVYSASHDLRSPLTGLMGLIVMAQKHENKPDLLVAYHQKMQYTVNKLDTMLSEILEYSYNTRLTVQLEKIDINALVDECFDELDHLPNFEKVERKITIQQDADLLSDRHRLEIIFRSLIKNAIQFCDLRKFSNFVHLDIKIAQELTMVFRDNGIGIKKSALPKVFDMFYRASTQSQGAGLGLYIVQEIVSKLEGHIQINSILDQGTSVMITLPNATIH